MNILDSILYLVHKLSEQKKTKKKFFVILKARFVDYRRIAYNYNIAYSDGV